MSYGGAGVAVWCKLGGGAQKNGHYNFHTQTVKKKQATGPRKYASKLSIIHSRWGYHICQGCSLSPASQQFATLA